MSMMLDYQDLWNKGGYGKDNPLENTIAFIRKQGKQMGLEDGIADLIINEVMLELADGKQYPTDKCPCGCGIDKSGTAITHEMLARLEQLGRQLKITQAKVLQERLNGIIVNHMHRENEAFVAENMKPSLLKRIFSGKKNE